ncbi:MAG: lytic transglycosylase domain-containing protein [Deltaproteobacteria bacterium]|jgi:soluble lytic murein transglycosylase|nr:lytic transglycosylase domain-containing protein [Deltaproteobacteria bacterium]
MKLRSGSVVFLAWLVLVLGTMFSARTEAALLTFAPEEQIGTAPDGSPMEHSPLGTPQDQPDSTQPYWVMPPESDGSDIPYWLQGTSPIVDDSAPVSEPQRPQGGIFAPPPPPPKPPAEPPKAVPKAQASLPTPSGVQVQELSYYMFKDENGVIHLTDAPADPRYQLFTMQITVSSGLAPFRRLNLEKLRPFIITASTTYKVDPALIAAVIKAESAFDPKAVSWVGARGLMQLMPNTAALVGCADSFDPEQNIMGGTKYLRMMLNRFNGNVILAVAAYNSGPERVARVMAVPEISETKNYVKTVLRNYEMFLSVF